jgi:hypothetical protein
MNQPVHPTSPLAITSLVSGVLGWTLLPLLGSLVAGVTGHMARSEIRRAGGSLGGDGLAIAGLVLGWLALAFAVLGIAMLLAFFGGVAWLAAVQ